MPWHFYKNANFWIAEHKADGIVIYCEDSTFWHTNSDTVPLYVVNTGRWQDYDRTAVRSALMFGKEFEGKHPNWATEFEGWDGIEKDNEAYTMIQCQSATDHAKNAEIDSYMIHRDARSDYISSVRSSIRGMKRDD